MVHGEAGRLEAMVTHLIQNAIDASEPAAPVRIMLDKSDQLARLRIEDQGAGMTQAFIRDGLFKPFHSTKRDGFGIGAFEAQEIVKAHGGRLQVRSRPGAGSCFTVILPMHEEQGAEKIDG